MNFYYRSLPEGRCEVVCTRCFLTLGAAQDMEEIRRIEASHQCAAGCRASAPSRPLRIPPPAGRARFHMLSLTAGSDSRPRAVRRSLLLMLAAMLLYAVPTALEFAALRHSGSWVSTVLLGDLAGCACLAIVFRRVKAGVLLYCLLTVFEAGAYALHILPLNALLWITDLVPTVLVLAMVVRSSGSSAKLIAIH